jgi:HEAT repeat protein
MGPIRKLINQLATNDEVERRVAICELADRGKDALDSLARALSDARPPVRWGAALALGRLAPVSRDTIPLLVEKLTDPVPYVARCAADALGQMGESAVEPLRGALARDGNLIKAGAARALGQIGAPAASAVPELIELFEHNDPQVRQEAALALGRVSAGRPKTFLRTPEMVGGGSAGVLECWGMYLCIALRESKCRSEEYFLPLWKLINRGSARVRDEAFRTLRSVVPGCERVREGKFIALPGHLVAKLLLEGQVDDDERNGQANEGKGNS